MKTIAVISQKGGAGKTTLAINLAGAAVAAGLETLIIDLDPQTSAKIWHNRRNKENPVVIFDRPQFLAASLTKAQANGAELCIIDTAPHSSQDTLEAAKVADLILIPCRPSYLDLQAIKNSVDIVKLAGSKPALFVLTCVRPGDKTLPDEAATTLTAKHKIPVSPVRITLRSDCVHALSAAMTIHEFAPNGAAAQETQQLFKLAFQQDRKLEIQQVDKERATA
jgi:chromosome partitioning protein